MTPTRVGWWWLWSADDRAVDGWLPMWVYSTPDGLRFWDGCTEMPARVSGYQWGGPVTRVADESKPTRPRLDVHLIDFQTRARRDRLDRECWRLAEDYDDGTPTGGGDRP